MDIVPSYKYCSHKHACCTLNFKSRPKVFANALGRRLYHFFRPQPDASLCARIRG